MLFLFTGIGGSGKDTLLNAVSPKFPSLKYFRTHTTRPRREGEDDSKYIFHDPSEGLSEDEYAIQVVCSNGWVYASSKKDIEYINTNINEHFAKCISTLEEYEQLLKAGLNPDVVIIIYIAVDEITAYQRLKARGGDEKEIERRKWVNFNELDYNKKVLLEGGLPKTTSVYIINNNGDLDRQVSDLETILNSIIGNSFYIAF